MRSRFCIILLIALLAASARLPAFSLPFFHTRKDPAEQLTARLRTLGGDSLQLQYSLVELIPGGGYQSIVSQGARLRTAPGSLMKLLTVATSLKAMGPGYRLQTRLCYDSTMIAGRCLRDTLHVLTGGDPAFSSADLITLVAGLRAAGIDSLSGPLAVYTGRFGRDQLGPGWMWDDGLAPWAARISAATINQNCELFGPDALTDSLSAVECWLPSSRQARRVDRPDSLFLDELSNAVRMIGLGSPECLLLEHTRSSDSLVTHAHSGPPLVQLADSILWESWNLGAEALFLEQAAVAGVEGWRAARQLQIDLLDSLNWISGWMDQVDGSGMSRYNQICPEQLTAFLAAVEKDELGLLRERMPSAGEGTLAGLAEPSPAVFLWGKTGTLRGRHALAGYLGHASGRMWAYCLVISGHRRSAEARSIRDTWIGEVTHWIAEQEAGRKEP
jgi:D-alanyl-D-alanine carboxypeptidase/D-alanyl-D-alanine-endopeptidase (penicillin-binding protein 4)